MAIEFFDRNDKGELIPIEREIVCSNEDILEKVKFYESKLTTKEEEQNNSLYLRIIELLKEEYEKSKEVLKIKFTPMVKFEIKNIKDDNVDCDGKKTDDQDASIIAKHLIEPKIKFNDARVMKNHRLKRKIVEVIYLESMPEIKESDELRKKLIALLMEEVKSA